MLVDTSSRYNNLKLNKNSYLTSFPCPFDRYWYILLPFGTAQAGDMFQKKVHELFNDIPYNFWHC